jgi:hypothetical protein
VLHKHPFEQRFGGGLRQKRPKDLKDDKDCKDIKDIMP